MDRIILGKATANGTSQYHHRGEPGAERHGLFISKPGANVHNCADGDLIFDSTAPGLVQILGRGRVSVPKQLYDKGLFGEAGTITDANWNSAGTVPTNLNKKTSWLFDVVPDVYNQIQEVIDSTRVPWIIRRQNNPTVNPSDLAHRADIYGGLDSGGFLSVGNSLTSLDLGDISSDDYIRTMSKKLWRIQSVFPFLSDTPLNYNFNNIMGPAQFPAVTSGPIINLAGGTSINTRTEPKNLYIPAYAGILENSSAIATSSRKIIDVLKVLSAEEIQSLIDNDDIFDFVSPAWKAAWANYVDDNVFTGFVPNAPLQYFASPTEPFYSAHTAWGILGANEHMIRDKPSPWRAWSSPGDSTSAEAEKALMIIFFQYQFILSWAYNNFGLYVNDDTNTYGPFDWSVQTSLNYNTDASDQNKFDHGYTGSATYGLPDYKVDAGTTPKNFTEYTSTGNWKYTEWKNGNIDISTGIEAPDGDSPVQVWWNSISRDTGNNATNLSFLNIRDSLIKSSTASERLTALKPGLTTITANTYVADTKIRLKFEQPSTEDIVEIYYTIFKETAFQATEVSAKGPTNMDENIVDSLIFNITDVSDPNYPGDNYAGRRQQDPTWTAMNQSSRYIGTTRSDYGRYYNIVFPDDFVTNKNDLFKGYRNAEGVIDHPLYITLNIPQGVEVSSNSYSELIKIDQLRPILAGESDGRGEDSYGPYDPAGRVLCEKHAMIDPCIFLNLHSGKFTDQALQGLVIRIENNGVLVGGGGYGQYGQMAQPNKTIDPNTSRETPGGGGGGGAGYHPPWVVEYPTGDPTIPGDPGWAGKISVDAPAYLASVNITANTLPETDPSSNADWVWHYPYRVDDKARYSDGTATSDVEKDAHRTAISLFWNGPNNYVEWGMGGIPKPENNNTGMNKITIDSIAPGKGGTGYMGVSPNQTQGMDHHGPRFHPNWKSSRSYGQDYTLRIPYYDTLLEARNQYGLYDRDLYPRIMGTYEMYQDAAAGEGLADMQWVQRFGRLSYMGNPGDPGTTTSGGSGGAKGTSIVAGSDQDTFIRVDWTGLGDGEGGNLFPQGLPAGGAGGSVVYLYANTHNSLLGLRVEMVNNETGMIKSGGGGGSGGGSKADGLGGGNLGRPGKWFTDGRAVHNARTSAMSATQAPGFPTDPEDSYYAWGEYTIRGEPGKLVWWNTSNVASNYTIENKSKTASCAIEGMDYNPGIAGWDYVSYLPDLNATRSGVTWVTTGLRLWGRKLGDGGYAYYTKLNEQSFEEYLASPDTDITITP